MKLETPNNTIKLELTSKERNVLIVAIQSKVEELKEVVSFGDIWDDEENARDNKIFLEAAISLEKKVWQQDHLS
tara:strand:- start:127 stop:348 length:222 start_codon:yes stop_codon:yes gene_type:complete